ncbi:MAG: hypothetical protein CHACPFDD_01860 [Phycisphaerae bacterium]|nr:hypothetical protein [Phycisphaerae bacterium]
MANCMNRMNTARLIEVPFGRCVVRRYAPAAVEPEFVRRAVGIRPGAGNHVRWDEAIDALSPLNLRLARPRAIFRVDRVRLLEPRRLTLDPPAVFDGAVGQFLAHSQYVASFVVTVGSALERLARRWLKRGQIVRGMVVDAIASEAAEAAAARCQHDVRAWALARGLEITPRYSPGYCGMDVRQQEPLFRLVPAGRIGVRLTPSYLMTPIKSVSGLIGIGSPADVTPEAYPCSRCDHPHCMQRRSAFSGRCEACFDWQGAANSE